jgi:hypothetical protein
MEGECKVNLACPFPIIGFISMPERTVAFAIEPVTLLQVHGRSEIIFRYGNHTCQSLENVVLRCDN